jgi:hypothetical protein
MACHWVLRRTPAYSGVLLGTLGYWLPVGSVFISALAELWQGSAVLQGIAVLQGSAVP